MATGNKLNVFSRNQLREIDEFAKNNGYLDAKEYLLEVHNNYKKTVNNSKPFKPKQIDGRQGALPDDATLRIVEHP